jgi:hypothetical protein
MQHPCNRTLWRSSFIDALQLVGEAAARLPVGASDPVLCGESAVELYTGGLWATDDLELYVLQPRLMTAELFGVGFRWTHHPRHAVRGLWHPELRIRVELIDDRAPLGPAALANLLTVAMSVERVERVGTSLKVIGIEDVIAEQVTSWRTRRVPSAQATTRIQTLIALARRGIGGPFRTGYLQRRFAHDTGGEVAFEPTWPGEATEQDTVPRTMALSNMGTAASTWWVAHGYTLGREKPHASHRPRKGSGRTIHYGNNNTEREGGSGTAMARIIPFDGIQPLPSASQHPEGSG